MTDPSPEHLEEPPGRGQPLQDGSVPEAELAAAVRARPTGSSRTGSGPVRWVRASDAVAELSSSAAGAGIDLHRELARRIPRPPAALQPVVADRIRSIAPAVRGILPVRAGDQLGRSR